METFNVFDVCVFAFTGLSAGMAIGVALRNKKITNLQDELDYLENKYTNLVDGYTDCIIEKHKLQFEKYLKPIPPVKKEDVVTTAPARKQAGRPKGSKNKTKENVKSTTRKYTRKSSK